MHDDTVTIFNRRLTHDGPVWYPTVLPGVHLERVNASAAARYGWTGDDKAAVMVPYVREGEALFVAGKQALPPKRWQAMEDPAMYVTFAVGEDFDFFLEGPWPDEEPIADSRWPEGLYEHLCRTRDGVYALSNAARYNALPHFELSGR